MTNALEITEMMIYFFDETFSMVVVAGDGEDEPEGRVGKGLARVQEVSPRG